MASFKAYIKLIKEEQKKFPKISFWKLLKFYKKWAHSFEIETEISELPWMTFEVIEFLQQQAKPDMIVFEYGSGSSTLFWSARVKKVISIEHDKAWSEKVIAQLGQKKRSNVDLVFIEPTSQPSMIAADEADPFSFATQDEQWKAFSFEKYVRQIEVYPNDYFDVVIVDGRARPSCIAAAVGKIKTGGFLVLDNSERDYYLQKTLPLLAASVWQRTDYVGPIAGAHHFSQTSVFKKLA